VDEDRVYRVLEGPGIDYDDLTEKRVQFEFGRVANGEARDADGWQDVRLIEYAYDDSGVDYDEKLFGS